MHTDKQKTIYNSKCGDTYTTTKLKSENINGETYTYHYDTLGNITDIYKDNTHLYYYEYDAWGNVLSITDQILLSASLGTQHTLIEVKHMIINYSNREEINKLYIHDSLFEGYFYDYQKREINLTCENHYLKKTFNFKFFNVIFSKLQSCCFWGSNCFYVYDIELKETTDELKQLMHVKNTNPDWFENSYLDKNDIKYIAIEIFLNSGDTLLIICETINFLEKNIK